MQALLALSQIFFEVIFPTQAPPGWRTLYGAVTSLCLERIFAIVIIFLWMWVTYSGVWIYLSSPPTCLLVVLFYL